jgi:hypothetical protein
MWWEIKELLMSGDSVKQKTAPQVQEAAAARFDLSIGEFCTRLTGQGANRTLVDAFKADQLAGKKTQGNEDDFLADFSKFKARPV